MEDRMIMNLFEERDREAARIHALADDIQRDRREREIEKRTRCCKATVKRISIFVGGALAALSLQSLIVQHDVISFLVGALLLTVGCLASEVTGLWTE